MKILYLTPGCFDKGGISRYNRFQINALREIVGVENVKIFSLLSKDPDNYFEDDFRVDWQGKSKFHLLRKSAFSIAVSRCAYQFKPDIIWIAHVHMSFFGVMLSKITRSWTVLNGYGLELWSGLNISRRIGLKNTNSVITDCQFSAKYLEEEIKVRSNNSVYVIWDTVDTTRFFPAPPDYNVIRKYSIPNPSENINLLTLGRMTRDANHKGYSRLLEAFAIAEKHDSKLRLIYAGGGDLISELQKHSKSLNISDKVHFIGMIHDGDLPDVYRSAHLFSLVSDRGLGRGEGVPVTPLEAAACGIPCIVGNQDGSPEAVIEGETGFVIDPFDLDTHVTRILTLSQNPELLKRMSISSALRLMDEFSYSQFLKKHRVFLSGLSMQIAR